MVSDIFRDTVKLVSSVANLVDSVSPGAAGRALARARVSEISEPLVDKAIEISDSAKMQEIMQAAINISNKQAPPDSVIRQGFAMAAEESVSGLVSGASLGPAGLINPISIATSIGTEGGDVMGAHKDVIAQMSKNRVPGYHHGTVSVNGENIEFWIDATCHVSKECGGGMNGHFDTAVYFDDTAISHLDSFDSSSATLAIVDKLEMVEGSVVNGLKAYLDANGGEDVYRNFIAQSLESYPERPSLGFLKNAPISP